MNLQIGNNTIGSENPVAAARAHLALSQHELADKLNTSFYALTRWERGDIEISKDILVLSRLRSGLSTHLCGLSFECQGAFPAKR